MQKLEQTQNKAFPNGSPSCKNFSEQNPSEGEIEEKVTFEKRLIVERRFSEPFKRKQRRKSPILRKCEDLMEALWEDSYHSEISWHALRDYIVAMCGGFRTTVTDYLGRRPTFYTSRGREGVLRNPGKEGYLERFGFIEKKSPKIVKLHHERVDRDYHRMQTNIPNFSLSNSREANERIEGATAPTNDTTLLLHTQSEREIKPTDEFSQFSPEEEAILRAKPSDKRETLQR